EGGEKYQTPKQRVKKHFRCTPCGCGCCCRWCGNVCLALVLLVLVVMGVNKFADWIVYMQLPVGVSVFASNYALATEAPTGRKALPLPSIHSNVLLNLRYRGDDVPEGYIRLFKVTASHPDIPEPVKLRYWDYNDLTVFKPSSEGLWSVTVHSGYRLAHNPYTDDFEDWTANSIDHDVESVTVEVTVLPLTSMEVSPPATTLPTVTDL
ncbi:hypothetical protein KIPB_012125, partial [Kipferlia bialata]